MCIAREWRDKSLTPEHKRGLVLTELLMVSVMAMVCVMAVQQFVRASYGSFNRLSMQHQMHGSFTVLREVLGSDVRTSLSFEDSVILDGKTYSAAAPTGANTLILRLAAVDASGEMIDDLYDFVVYEAQPIDTTTSKLFRHVYTNRDDAGRSLKMKAKSVRIATSRMMIARALTTIPGKDSGALFLLNRPVVARADTMLLAITLISYPVQNSKHALKEFHSARFQLRNHR